MAQLAREDLFSLEEYAEQRAEFRARVMEHKKSRQVHLGEHATLYFENKLTMQYQIQEMLRIEKIFDKEGIQEELDAYNPLIPDGNNLKATFMVEYDDVDERKVALAQLIGIEDKVWIQIKGFDKSYAIADEDLERDNAEKTSSVHFMRFEFTDEMVAAAKSGADIAIGVEHSNYTSSMDPVPTAIRDSLTADFD
ncbi:MAG: DUF3501 family protein [Gammaproteobacteria bacterium]|nr:DUF3501 family protein [Gammaproteobacteria bacterium]MDH5776791.1 DUF3501 family protein [Gammaproteobacteria bacterium]